MIHNLSPGATPPISPRESRPSCRRDCCWSPFGHALAAWWCRCHGEPLTRRRVAEVIDPIEVTA